MSRDKDDRVAVALESLDDGQTEANTVLERIADALERIAESVEVFAAEREE